MNIAIITLPIINVLLCSYFGNYIGQKGSKVTSIVTSVLNAVFAWILYYDVIFCEKTQHITLGKWIQSGILDINWALLYDPLSTTMLIIVTTISALVHIYATEYMKEDPHICRFLAYLSMFTFFMLFLILSDNFIQLFFGWEGVGICSYLLISFWFTRVKATRAAAKAVIMNRIGDIFFIIAMGSCFLHCGSLKFSVVFSLVETLSENKSLILGYPIRTLDLIAGCFLLGAMGKSAQIGLHAWLPDAMEGPTPVSALIHSATMVTAGVFLIVRCSYIFEQSPEVLKIVTYVGGMTAFISATIAAVQKDIKKIIAYSTCSQLGYMFFACGLSNYQGAIFHAFNHAFFKALLFLAAGSVIHASKNEQDIRKLGGLRNIMPVTYTTMLIGSMSLTGFPFMSGFYSKEHIMNTAIANNNWFIYYLGLTTTMLTGYYTFKLFIVIWSKKPKSSQKIAKNITESKYGMLIPLIVLAVGSVVSGYLFKDLFIGMGTHTFKNTVHVNNERTAMLYSEFVPPHYKKWTLYATLIGILGAIILHGTIPKLIHHVIKNNIKLKRKNTHLSVKILQLKTVLNPIITFLSKKWYYDIVYNKLIGYPILKLSYRWVYKALDKGIWEWFGPRGILVTVRKISWLIKKGHTGNLHKYITCIGPGIVLIYCSTFF